MKKKLLLGLTMVMLMGALAIGGITVMKTDPPFGLEVTDIQNL